MYERFECATSLGLCSMTSDIIMLQHAQKYICILYVDICMKSEHMRSLINRRVAVDSYVAYDTNAYRADTSVACAHDTIPYDQPHDQSAIVRERKRERERVSRHLVYHLQNTCCTEASEH